MIGGTLNWVGFVMLMLAFILFEAFLGITTYYELDSGALRYEFNTSAMILGIIYLVVAVTLTLWPGPSDETA